jgi:glycerophosphoryl diester phosphodiesterase
MKPLGRCLGIVCLLVAHPALALDLQGHRGARGLAPENTLPAFATALSLGVTTLELDTGVTRDDVVVISHNPALNPDITRDGAGKWLEGPGPAIRALTFAELQQYDVGRIKPGTDYARQFPEQTIDERRMRAPAAPASAFPPAPRCGTLRSHRTEPGRGGGGGAARGGGADGRARRS